MFLRIINKEGKDEVYEGVLKLTYVGAYLHIYLNGRQYKELASDIEFMQIWRA